MSNIRLVTGYAGEAHVTAADAGSLHAALAGSGQYVLKKGSQFAASVVNSNTIRIADGDLLMQGRHARIAHGDTVDLTIENGTSGYYRNDLIVARYTKDAGNGVESVTLAVIKGAASTTAAIDPAYTSGDILSGDALLNEMPLYRIALNGLNVQAPVPLYTVQDIGGHALDKANPHKVTAEQVGAAPANHSHALDGLTNVHICESTPSSVINGHWYLVKEG